MTILLEILINKIIGYVSHPVVDTMYCTFTATDLGVISRVNDKVFWALNSSNPTMKDFAESVSMSMYGCINMKFNTLLRNTLKINSMSISIEIK